jgi:hypothetical protein
MMKTTANKYGEGENTTDEKHIQGWYDGDYND